MRILPIAVLALMFWGCGKGNSPAALLSVAPAPGDPVLQNIKFVQDGSPVQQNAPIASSQIIYPDLGTDTCSNAEASITFLGTYDNTTVSSFAISGVSTSVVTTSGNSFSIQACVAQGAAAVTIATLNSSGGKDTQPLFISLSIKPLLRTLGLGLPVYPNPGLQALSGAASATLIAGAGGTVNLSNLMISETGSATIVATGNTALQLEVGPVNIIKQVDP